MNAARKSRRGFLKSITRLVVISGSARMTFAHAKLVRSSPKDGEVLHVAPGKIELWFNELLDDGVNTMQVFAVEDKAKKNLLKEKPRLDPQDRTHLFVDVPHLEAGAYRVEFRVLSRDGHTAPGRFTFRVAPKP